MQERAWIFAWIEARFENVHWGKETNRSEEVVEFLDSAEALLMLLKNAMQDAHGQLLPKTRRVTMRL